MKIKFVKYLPVSSLFLIVLLLFPFFQISSIAKDSLIFFKDNDAISKVSIKVDYTDKIENPNFFGETTEERFLMLGESKKLCGFWMGSYEIAEDSIVWVNPELSKNEVINEISFGTYNIYLKLGQASDNPTRDSILMQVVQEDIDYDAVNIDRIKDKQINYWTKAQNKNWFEVIKGKILRTDEEELFTVFQTTVYQNKTPLYAFQGEATLVKADDSE